MLSEHETAQGQTEEDEVVMAPSSLLDRLVAPMGSEVEEMYEHIRIHHEHHLEGQGVKLPKLMRGGSYNNNAIQLVLLAANIHVPIEIDAFTEYVRRFKPSAKANQQPRQLRLAGWRVLICGKNRSKLTETITFPDGRVLGIGDRMPNPYNMLVSLTDADAEFREKKRSTDMLSGDNPFYLKLAAADHTCPVCRRKVSNLEEGHLDPRLPIGGANSIPMCPGCNNQQGQNYSYKVGSDGVARFDMLLNAEFIMKKTPADVKRELKSLLAKCK